VGLHIHYLIRHWADLISATTLSEWLQDNLWVIPTSQSIHILCISVVFASAVVISTRILGVGMRGRSVSQLVATLVPWMYRALIGLLVTGLIQTIAEPMRQFVAPVFWWKMTMIICVVLLTVWFTRQVRAQAGAWDGAGKRIPIGARAFACVSLCLWTGIIFCGRFIGYTYQAHL
jgi:hypothetical protein